MFNPKHMYQLFGNRGRIGMYIRKPHIVLEVDPEGSSSCLLTLQDTVDVVEILRAMGAWLCEECGERPNSTTSYDHALPHDFCWKLAGGQLRVFLNQDSQYLQVCLVPAGQVPLTVQQVAELGSVLEHFVGMAG